MGRKIVAAGLGLGLALAGCTEGSPEPEPSPHTTQARPTENSGACYFSRTGAIILRPSAQEALLRGDPRAQVAVLALLTDEGRPDVITEYASSTSGLTPKQKQHAIDVGAAALTVLASVGVGPQYVPIHEHPEISGKDIGIAAFDTNCPDYEHSTIRPVPLGQNWTTIDVSQIGPTLPPMPAPDSGFTPV